MAIKAIIVLLVGLALASVDLAEAAATEEDSTDRLHSLRAPHLEPVKKRSCRFAVNRLHRRTNDSDRVALRSREVRQATRSRKRTRPS